MPKRKKNNDDNDNCSGEEEEYIQPGSTGGGGGGRIGRGKAKTGQQKGPGSRSRGGQTSAAVAAVASQSMMPITSGTSEIDPSSSSQQQTCSVLSSLGTSTFDDYSQSLSLKPDHVNRPLWITRDHTIYLGE